MRLLRFDQAGRLLLTNFSGKTTPPYAILSHRWGNSEVLFADIANGNYKEKEGYRKIKFCAEQAAKDQLQYFWIDTCCIDKWNLSKLLRSINSMFCWYKDAKRCYVFLPDVSVPTTAAIAQQSDWEASFRASEWFRRGWTLQELIAPESVEFFSLEGQRIGDKRSLEQLVHEISNVPTEALQGFSLEKFTIKERIEWAKNRETTEEEGNVYCLLGILDVSMPASYGEGREKARIRLEAELNSSAPFLVPFSQNNNFVGGESQLAELEAKFFKGNQAAIVAIVGPGGTGKSQLALEFAYRTRQKNKSCSVFWIDASSIDGAHHSYTDIARKLKIPGWDDEKADVKQIVKLQLSRRDAGQSLLIFDNADSVKLSSNGTSAGRDASLVDYLPQSEHCSILLTTTNGDAARTVASHEIIELQEMEQDTAQSMLEQYLDTPVSRSEQQHAELLLQELSHLPLAIVQAAAYINARSITLQEYYTRLTKQRQADLDNIINVPDNKLQEYDRGSSVATTLHLSIEQIRHDSPLAAKYLFLAACVDRKDILLELLEAPSSREREDAIRILNSYKLVTRRPAESALDLHRLVHGALREWIWKRGMLGEWTQTAMARLCGVFPNNSHGNRITVTKKYNEAEELFLQVMETSLRVLGDEHPSTLTSMANLASTYRNQGRWKEAEELQATELGICSRVLGDEHPDTLTSMANLAFTLQSQGSISKAASLIENCCELQTEVLGPEHPDTVSSRETLAAWRLDTVQLKDEGDG
ncbi:HET-domain-containing protein [Lentithecium fluviatile CBS 122367]|uniref:HET-domain-containing protein n=1 Tax=Lentithecium fluviatile CBS 122367 TaxID=1168545 RepID=A0A6G1JJF9_9PLEO|nr:HET-domain-containing protein [Lentithecium fluviatile CBS 122367]